MAVSSPKVPLVNKPGVTNWVEKYGALQPHATNWIHRAAEHIHGKGKSTGTAIAFAVNAAKKMCATGDTNFPGVQQVNAGSRAQACAAVRKWESAKAKAKAARLKESGSVSDEEWDREWLRMAEAVIFPPTANLYGPLALVEAKRGKRTGPDKPAATDAKGDDYTLTKGAKKPLVRHLQSRLSSLGHEVKVDGDYGNKTADAVRRFRSKSGLPDGDQVDEQAVDALRNASAPVSSGDAQEGDGGANAGASVLRRTPGGEKNADVTAMQTGLIDRGYDVGAAGADGYFGAETEKAVRKFQRDHGLRQDGVVAKHTQRVMKAVKLSEAPITDARSARRAQRQMRRGAAGPAGPKGRGGKQVQDPQFERLHPRAPMGRTGGGEFIEAGSSGPIAQGIKSKLGGEVTTQSIRQYQRENNLTVDGLVGHQTAASLLGHSKAPKVQIGALSDHDRRRLRQQFAKGKAKGKGKKLNEAETVADHPAFSALVAKLRRKGISQANAEKMAKKALRKKLSEGVHGDGTSLGQYGSVGGVAAPATVGGMEGFDGKALLNQRPPNLRNATDERRCGNCRFWNGSGQCALYGYPTGAVQVSDSFMPRIGGTIG